MIYVAEFWYKSAQIWFFKTESQWKKKPEHLTDLKSAYGIYCF